MPNNKSGTYSAAELLVIAYIKGAQNCEEVDWEDVDLAWEVAKDELGEEAVAELEERFSE